MGWARELRPVGAHAGVPVQQLGAAVRPKFGDSIMKRELDPQTTKEAQASKDQLLKEAGGGVLGAIGGAGLGVLAGPPGIAAGAVIGAVAGTLTSWAMDSGSSAEAAAEEELDKEIGVAGGDIGVARLPHPAAKRAAISAAAAGSAGVAADSQVTADGPIAAPPNEE
jgi:hypothetical protein